MVMAPPVEFSEAVITEAWERQNGRCAACGKQLSSQNRQSGQRGAWQPHHIRPVAFDGLGTLENCVVLCVSRPEDCHRRVGHQGHFGQGAVPSDEALIEMYPYYHG